MIGKIDTSWPSVAEKSSVEHELSRERANVTRPVEMSCE